MGRLAAARAALAEISDQERDSGRMRSATAVVYLAKVRPTRPLTCSPR